MMKTKRNLTIYLHGDCGSRALAEVKLAWDEALYSMAMGDTTSLGYFQDLIDPGVPLADLPLVFGIDSVIEKQLDELLEPVQDTKRREFVKSIVFSCLPRVEKLQIGERSWNLLRLVRFALQAATYLMGENIRKEIHQRILDPDLQKKTGENQEIVVISSGIGNLVAWDILNDRQTVGVNWLSMGSSLGIEPIQRKLLEGSKKRKLHLPKSVSKACHITYACDPLAVSPRDAFAGIGENDVQEITTGNFFAHAHRENSDDLAYLKTDETRKFLRILAPNVSPTPVNNFLIAKDVADQMEFSNIPIHTLIELKKSRESDTLNQARGEIIDAVLESTRGREDINLEPLRRYVAASLTTVEIKRIRNRINQELSINRIWSNGTKNALLNHSAKIVKAEAARQTYAAAGAEICWAVLDTGIDAENPHFEKHNNIEACYDCMTAFAYDEDHPNLCATPTLLKGSDRTDLNGHGTHVAGIIAGQGEYDGAPIYSIAPETKIQSFKVLNDEKQGHDSSIIRALEKIVEINNESPDLVIHGVNLSLGGSFDPEVYGCGHSPICKELQRLWRQGVLIVVAAGNTGLVEIETRAGIRPMNVDVNIGDPANLEEAIAVGSVHKTKPHVHGISYFSSRGPTADGRFKPDCVAPGERIISARSGHRRKDGYTTLSGTSMACPHVSGVLAAFLSLRREFIGRPDAVRDILINNCMDLKRDRYAQGAGIPNLHAMLSNT